jgi:transposase-like protein
MSSNSKAGRTPNYDPAFKIRVARDYLTSSLGYGGIAKKYGIPRPTIVFFVKWYRKKYPDGVIIQKAESNSEEIPAPLAKELQQANLKITGLEMLIEIAEQELGIDIIKKFGAKQSKK